MVSNYLIIFNSNLVSNNYLCGNLAAVNYNFVFYKLCQEPECVFFLTIPSPQL